MSNVESGSSAHLTRIHNSVLAPAERSLLQSIAKRLPAWTTPDQLTFLGVVGAAVTGVAAVAANFHPGFYLVAIVGLVLNWFGDSLDGSLARHRQIERPRYGFFVDQFSDVASHFFMLIGLGLSPLMQLDTALLALLGSLAVMFYGHLKLQFSRTWQVSHHGVGPTEFRILIAGGLVLASMGSVPEILTPVGIVTLFDAVAVIVFLAAVLSIGFMFIADRAILAEIDPPRHRAPQEVIVRPIGIQSDSYQA